MLNRVVAAIAAPIRKAIGQVRSLALRSRLGYNESAVSAIPVGQWGDAMGFIYVARSAKLARWASDVGLGRHVYKVGVAEADPKTLAAAGWAGESDWTIVRKRPVEDLSEEEALARLALKEKIVDPNLYPKLKGTVGVFRLTAPRVENHLLVTRALAGEDRGAAPIKPKHGDFADYLIHNALH
jgi:hypothetical protein